MVASIPAASPESVSSQIARDRVSFRDDLVGLLIVEHELVIGERFV